jgi:hypothetical protein
MVIFFSVILKELFGLGRDYPFPKPSGCPRCKGFRLWGHGFVSAYFDGYNQPFCLRRYRCPECGCVLRLRPKGYFKRFQASITAIRKAVVRKAQCGKWIAGIGRSRQCHWFRSLLKRIRAYLTDTWCCGIAAGFDCLFKLGQNPVSRAI